MYYVYMRIPRSFINGVAVLSKACAQFSFFVSLDMPLCVFLLLPSFFMFQTERMSRRQCDRERNHQEWGCGKQEWRLLVMTNLSIYSHWANHKNMTMYAFWGYIAYIDVAQIIYRCLSRCHLHCLWSDKLMEEVDISGLGFGALYFSFLITRPSTLKKKDDIALREFFFHMFFH